MCADRQTGIRADHLWAERYTASAAEDLLEVSAFNP